MEDMKAAYEKYLAVFPQCWDPSRYEPKSFEDFKGLYVDAKIVRASYEKELCQGIMNPVAYFMMLALDEYLGIVHTDKERRYGFEHGFVKAKATHR